MEIILAIALVVMAINHTDETPVKNLYQEGGTIYISEPRQIYIERGAGGEVLPGQALIGHCTPCQFRQ